MNVALNISSRNIKILSMQGRRVIKWASHDLAAGMVRDGLILQPQALGEAISSLFKSAGMPKKNVIASIAGLSFTYRFISLPRLKPALLDEAILRAARKEMALPLDELYLSWAAIPGKGEEQEYFILGVQRNPVDAAVETLKIAGIEPHLMDLRSLALARTAVRSEAIVASMEPDCFDIVFINNGLPAVMHTITPRSEGATLEDNIRRLADELTKTAAFYQGNQPDNQLSSRTPLLLTGELAVDPATYGLLQSEVEYTIEHLIPAVGCPDNLPVPTYAASIGLALKGTSLKPSARGGEPHFLDINVNIFAGKYRKPKAKPLPVRYWLTAVILVALVVLLWPLYQARAQIITNNSGLEDNLNSINRELNMANMVNEETMKTENTISEITASGEALRAANNAILDTKGYFSESLQRVNGAIPSGVSFTAIEILKGAITIKGEADSVFTVVTYATELEALGVFQEVRITKLDEALIFLPGDAESESAPPGVNVITFEILAEQAAP